MVLVLLYGSGSFVCFFLSVSFVWFWFFRSASVWSTQNSRCPEGLLRTSCWCSRLLFLHQFEAGWLTGSDCWYWEQRSFTTAPSFFQSQANYWSLEAAQKGSLTGWFSSHTTAESNQRWSALTSCMCSQHPAPHRKWPASRSCPTPPFSCGVRWRPITPSTCGGTQKAPPPAAPGRSTASSWWTTWPPGGRGTTSASPRRRDTSKWSAATTWSWRTRGPAARTARSSGPSWWLRGLWGRCRPALALALALVLALVLLLISLLLAVATVYCESEGCSC